MRTVAFWREAAERAVKSAAQALLGLWPLDQFNILDADPRLAGGIAAGAAVLSVLTSLASTAIGRADSPAALPEVTR
jgi:hypothetical protein